MSGLKPSWLSYALSGALAIMASWVLSGCYFGNRTVNQPVQGDGVTGTYATLPQTLQYCASVASSSNEKCVYVSTSQIPADYTSIFTNPVALELANASTGDAWILPYPTPPNSNGIEVTVGSNQTFSSPPASATNTLWDDPACSREDNEGVEGSFGSGRVEFTLTYTIEFTGNCAASLQAMANCYNDATQCGTHSQSDAQSLFEPFIDATAMSASDIPNLTGLAYEMVYQ